MVTNEQIQAFLERAVEDDAFATQLEDNPVGALGKAGFGELADAARREEERLTAIVARIARDDGFRGAIEKDPVAALRHELPEPALEPFLIAIGAPEAVVARATVDVEGHMRADSKVPVAAVAVAVLGALAVGQQASAAAQPNPWTYGNPVQSGSLQPNPMGSGSLQPNPLRSGSLQPNPLRSGSLQPNPLRSASLKPTLRWGKAEWQALRQTYRIK